MRSVTTNKKVFDENKEYLKFSQPAGRWYTWIQGNNEILQKEANMLNLRNRYNTHSFIVFRYSTKEIKYKYKKKATIYKTKTELEEE